MISSVSQIAASLRQVGKIFSPLLHRPTSRPSRDPNRFGPRSSVDVGELAHEPLLLLHRVFGSRGWFDANADCQPVNRSGKRMALLLAG